MAKNFGKKINLGDFYGAALEMDIYKSDGEIMQGLFNRRMTERGVLLFGDYIRKVFDSISNKHFEKYYKEKTEIKKNATPDEDNDK